MKKLLKYGVIVLVMAVFLGGIAWWQRPDGNLHVFMLNVGQGDSFLVRAPDGEKMLIDGGPDSSVVNELPKVMPFYDDRIDYILLTHPHPDHVNGLVEVLRRYKVKTVFINGINYNYPTYTEFLRLIADKNINLVIADSQSDFLMDSLRVDFLYPERQIAGKSFINANLSSIVIKVIYGGKSFLFMGDLEISGEMDLISLKENLKADVLKVGHHGSRTATSSELLNVVKPTIAFVSCGVDNKFKHPHGVIIDLLQNLGIQIYRTDLDGQVEITSDGISLDVRSSS